MQFPDDDALGAALVAKIEPDEDWQPTLFAADDPKTSAALSALLSSGQVVRVYDSILEQAGELLETREPRRKIPRDELEQRARDLVGPRPHAYGTWVFYPWSKRLVHVLPEDAFLELRTSRNRNKITKEEQERLRGARVGVLGLSVGSATAMTLAMEGVGGELVLADFDRLSLSNMNRLRAGVHEIGVRKTVLTARAIYELNPYARVSVFSEGIHDGNIDAFLDGPRLDLLFEECDDLFLKIKIRERARELRIPVLMETSDRGLIDVERFDLEPHRPLLHGLPGDVRADSLRGLTTYEKVPIVLRIIGAETISPRMAASLVEIDESLKTWPQLASAISLGAALNTDTGRRILLGQMTGSGRFHIDLEELITPEKAEPIPPPDDDAWLEEATPPLSLPRLSPVANASSGGLSREQVRDLVTYATLAPSGGNCQPWSFVWRGDVLSCIHEVERSRSFLDFQNTASYLAFGALAETVRIAAAEMGLMASIQPFPDERDPLRLCDIKLTPSSNVERDPLFAYLGARVTDRRLPAREPIEEAEVRALIDFTAAEGARLSLVTDDEGLDKAAALLGAGDRIRFLSPVMHREMMNEVRWTREEVQGKRDGLDIRSLELDPTDRAGMRVTSAWNVMELVGRFGGGTGLEKLAKKGIAAASAVGLLSVPGVRPLDFFEGGRVLQRLWLTATARGYALHPMTALLYMFARLVRGGGEGFTAQQREELVKLRARHEELFPDAQPGELLLFRMLHGGPVKFRALRRPVEDVLRFED